MKEIKEAIERVVGELALPEVEYVVEHPGDERHGDWSSNIAMAIFAKNKESGISEKSIKSPRELAQILVTKLQNDTEIASIVQLEKITVAGPGFINFWLTSEYLASEVGRAVSDDQYGMNDNLKGKKVMVEYTDPNPFKEFHIGHLMSNTIGESIARLMESQGALVKRVNYQGDVGLHVAKSVWGMSKKMEQEGENLAALEEKSITERQRFMGAAYALGATAYEDPTSSPTSLGARDEIIRINKAIYDESDTAVMKLYKAGREWSLQYFETIYARLGTKFDEYFFESEAGPVGLTVVEEGLAKEVLEIGEGGAVVYKGEKDGLHTRVFRNSMGLPTYEAKDLGLAKSKYGRYKYDLSVIVTANEITEYFRVVLRVMEQLYPDLRKMTLHMPHGVMKLTTGKMSSRTGKVVTGEGLLDELRRVVLSKMETSSEGSEHARKIENKDEVADKVAVGAMKWTVLRQQIGGDIVYDPEKMTNLQGDTGPYVQYTYARAKSVLAKAKTENKEQRILNIDEVSVRDEELNLMRWIARYPEVVMQSVPSPEAMAGKAGEKVAPNVIASYLYELSSRFNSFYNGNKIAGNEGRVVITQAVANVLKSGLNLLGIAAPREM